VAEIGLHCLVDWEELDVTRPLHFPPLSTKNPTFFLEAPLNLLGGRPDWLIKKLTQFTSIIERFCPLTHCTNLHLIPNERWIGGEQLLCLSRNNSRPNLSV